MNEEEEILDDDLENVDTEEVKEAEVKTTTKQSSGKYKGSDRFKEVIKNHLEERALADELFAETFKKPNKNIDDCVTYILNTVKDSGQNGFADDEIFNMAIHYYDEDDIKVGKASSSATVVVNHKVDLTEEELKEAKESAIKKAEDAQYKKMTQKIRVIKPVSKEAVQTSLF